MAKHHRQVKCCNVFHILANKKRADMVKMGGGPKTPDFTTAEELVLQHNRGRPIMEDIAGGSFSEQAGSSVRRPYVKVAGHSVTLLQPTPIVLGQGEEPTDEASPDDDETVSASFSDVGSTAEPCPDPVEPDPSHSAGTGDGENESESQGDVRTLYNWISSGLLVQVDWLQVIFRMNPDDWDPLLPDRCHIVEHCSCNSDVTCPVWRHPQPPKTCESGLQLAKGHLYPGSCSSKSPLETGLRPWCWLCIRGHEVGFEGITRLQLGAHTVSPDK
ncbi:hypothetical protein AAFF_G00209940 [Aldrovandia affinis]|uniref:Uncharacterized protein n=1 Tax=Aldrovandia affinis TaxID=143900 RepID=A0AAD7SX73_9TELE|nr:hypothetical protein AAFF_G00209940 [Aldrovandia affinis]